MLPYKVIFKLPFNFFLPAERLTIDDHFVVTRRLKDLNNKELISLGGALGLQYPSLKRMSSLMNEVVCAWLSGKDRVLTVSGPPSWDSLACALEEIDQHGLAQRIREGTTTCCLMHTLIAIGVVEGNQDASGGWASVITCHQFSCMAR